MITKFTVFEDNTGAEELARTAKYRPRTKHIAVKYHHFREHVRNGTLQIARIDTKNQLADIFTKGLPKPQFETLRHQIQGWCSMLTKAHNKLTTDAYNKYALGWS